MQSSTSRLLILFVFAHGMLWEFVSTDSISRADDPLDVTAPNIPVANGERHALALKAIATADQIPDERARAAAQWQLVQPLVELGLRDLATKQAMKLRTSNPQTCIYSLTTIAIDAIRRGDNKEVNKAWSAALDVNTNAERRFDHYVIELCFKLDRPLEDAIAIASTAPLVGRARAYCDVRDELASRGRVDEAYRIVQTYLTAIAKEIHDREIAYRCASAKQLVPNPAPDHFEQAIRIIQQMPIGEHRDFVITSLVENLLDVTSNQPVSEDRMALAERWAREIQDDVKRAQALRSMMQHRLSGFSVAELEHKLSEVASREEQEELLSRMFRALIDAGRLQDADAILPRRIQLIKDQPRPKSKSPFGSFGDQDAIRVVTWTHEQEMVRALTKAGRKDDARIRLEAMKNLPEGPPMFFTGNLESIRLALYLELEDYDSFEQLVSKRTDSASRAAGMAALAARLIAKGQGERGLAYLQLVLKMPPEALFPASVRSLYAAAEPYGQLAVALFKDDQTDEAQRMLRKIPEHEQTAHVFESIGELLVRSGRLAELDQWLGRLPHHTASTAMCLGALHELSKLK